MKNFSPFLAPIVVVFFFGIILLGNAWELPSMQRKFAETDGPTLTVNMIVKGLRCRGTSNFFMKIVGQVPGVISVSTYVQEHRATIKYDPSKVNLHEISQIVEQPVQLRDGRVIFPFEVLGVRETREPRY